MNLSDLITSPTQLAALLCAVLALGHSLIGEYFLIGPLCRHPERLPRLLGQPQFAAQTLRMAWHLTTLLGLLLAVLIWQLPIGPEATHHQVQPLMALTFGLCALWAAATTRGRHLAWVVLGGIAWLLA